MKKLLSLSMIAFAALTFTSCAGEEDDIFGQSAAERLNAASDLYSSRLMASPNGWAMQLYPTYTDETPFGNGYLVLCDFNKDHTVKAAMNNSMTGNKYKEDISLWEVITDNGPVLSFNSYNEIIHLFSNPEDVRQTSDDDETGEGIGGDYEFIVVDAPEDASYIMLKGKKRGTYNLLTPMENDIDFEEYLEDVKAFQNLMFPVDGVIYDVINFNGKLYKMDGADDLLPNIYPFDGDAVIDEQFNPFLLTKWNGVYHLRFRDAIDVDEETKVQDFAYDEEKDQFVSVDNENCFIYGSEPFDFFQSNLKGGGRWQIEEKNSSEPFSTLYNNVNQGFKKLGSTYSVSNMNIVIRNDEVALRIVYKAGKSTATIFFHYDMQNNGDNVKLQFKEAEGAASNVYNNVSGVKEFVEFLSQDFILDAAQTRFNMLNLKFTPVANPDSWFTVKKY